MHANHIFIFCDNHEEASQELIDFGFVEGSNRIHPNQGTRNRKFYFNDFYIEVLWVHDANEATNEMTAPTKLYERSIPNNNYSPFGLCLNYLPKDDVLFKESLKYQPTYLPKDMVIEVLNNENAQTLPWTFRWKMDISKYESNEPINFSDKSISEICFGIKENEVKNHYLKLFNSKEIVFTDTDCEYLKLVFERSENKRIKKFSSLPLIVEF